MVAPAPPQPGPAVPCPRCNAPGVWHAQAHQWGCDHCRQLIGGPPQYPAPAVASAIPFSSQPVPQCPRCWGNATWHPQVGKWGCDRCKTFLDPTAIAATTAPTNDAGLKIVKVLAWLILLIVLIAIKVALRKGHF